MKTEQLRVHNILLDTIRLLCKNSLPFNQSLRIEGVIGITTDSSDVFLVHVNETLGTDNSSSIVKQETSHEGSFGMVTPVEQSHTVSAPPSGHRGNIKIEEDVPPAEVADFSYRRTVAKPLQQNAKSSDMPVLHKVQPTRSIFVSESSSSISSLPVTQAFMLGLNNGLQNEGIYYEEHHQDEYGDQQDYQTGEEQEMWSTGYDSQHHNTNHQKTFTTQSKLGRASRIKQAVRGGGGRSGARVGKLGQSRAPTKSVNNTVQRNQMSAGSAPNQFVITQATHVCGYPDCMKRFSFKQALLRHQTKAHGREPVKRGAPKKTSHSSSVFVDDFGSGMVEDDYNDDAMDNSNNYVGY